MAVGDPRVWTDAELSRDRGAAEARFVVERSGEGAVAFYSAWDAVEPQVRGVFVATDNLSSITGSRLLAQKGLWQTLRYFCAPPISEEDLWTLVGKKFKNLPPEIADKAAAAFGIVIDHRRFPWLAEARQPMPAELSKAIFATTLLLAHETFKTRRRGVSSRAQEAEVAAALLAAGVTYDALRTPVTRLDELQRHSFARERKLAGAKCDIPVRLKDGRLLALECKVSNGPKNSWKRLQREVGGKADTWRRTFGSQVVTGAVLSGVFDLSCVRKAQADQGVAIFWQHDLSILAEFVQR